VWGCDPYTQCATGTEAIGDIGVGLDGDGGWLCFGQGGSFD
jgi:hypothetical protein